MKSLVVGEQPPGYDVGDAYHYILMRLLMAARANDLQVIDGPYLQIRDVEGFHLFQRTIQIFEQTSGVFFNRWVCGSVIHQLLQQRAR